MRGRSPERVGRAHGGSEGFRQSLIVLRAPIVVCMCHGIASVRRSHDQPVPTCTGGRVSSNGLSRSYQGMMLPPEIARTDGDNEGEPLSRALGDHPRPSSPRADVKVRAAPWIAWSLFLGVLVAAE